MTRDSAPVMNHVDRLVHEVILGSLFINNNTPITTVTSSVFVESASLYINVDSVAFTILREKYFRITRNNKITQEYA